MFKLRPQLRGGIINECPINDQRRIIDLSDIIDQNQAAVFGTDTFGGEPQDIFDELTQFEAAIELTTDVIKQFELGFFDGGCVWFHAGRVFTFGNCEWADYSI